MEGNYKAMEEIFFVSQSRNNQLEEGAVIDKGVPSNIQQYLYQIHCFFFSISVGLVPMALLIWAVEIWPNISVP
jgi:hypothetical protein